MYHKFQITFNSFDMFSVDNIINGCAGARWGDGFCSDIYDYMQPHYKLCGQF